MFGRKQFIVALIGNIAKAVVPAIIASVFVWYVGGRITAMSNAMYDSRSLAAFFEKRGEIIDGLRATFARVAGGDTKLAGALPEVDNILEFIAAFDTVAAKNGITHSVTYTDPVSAGSVHSVSFTARVSANVFVLKNYIRDFEALPYFASIHSIDMNAQLGDWRNNSAITMQGILYTK